MPVPVLPHLVPDPGCLHLDGWCILDHEEWVPLSDSIDSWDYNTDLRLRFSGTVDAVEFQRSTGLTATDPLVWVLGWRNIDGRLAGHAGTIPLVMGEPFSAEVVLPADELGPVVELRATLALAGRADPETPGAATQPGSILHQEVVRLVLVGDLARFPVTTTDFASRGLDPDASWALDLPSDLATPVLGGIVLLINERDRELVGAVATGSSRGKALLEQLQEEVAAQLLDHAVANADALLEEDWEDDTIGKVLRHLGGRVDGDLPVLVALRNENPAAYQALLIGEARRSGLGRRLE